MFDAGAHDDGQQQGVQEDDMWRAPYEPDSEEEELEGERIRGSGD